ncbi:MAG: phosphoribosylformylglycinamidine synthase II, partial [Elusimicrobia bacterium]
MVKPEVYRSLGLSDEEYKRIIDLLKREPSTTELAMFSVEWSEHCGYPRSRNLLKLLPKKGKYPTLIGEDSGGIIVDDLAIIFKMESHNHPSQIEPKQGAATGIGGIIRDIFTAGARPIASLNSLRFGPLTEPYNRYLLRGVVDGIQFYGNCLGVPTVAGEIYFDESYSGNCLVNVMSIGVAKKDELARAFARGVGNSIMYVGSSTGRDGIGGCSVLASHEFKEGEEKRPTVQIGDPFTEKCLIEATLEALATGHVVGIKDMGAAGLTCSTSEMASVGNSGMEVELQLVPRREADMEPWEIMMSESQERMLVCVKKGKEKEIEKIFSKWDL